MPKMLRCESCGAQVCGTKKENTCHGCEKVVCQSCVDVFGHFGEDGLHGTGDPELEVNRLRKERDDAFEFIRRFSRRIDPYAHDAWCFLQAYGEDRRENNGEESCTPTPEPGGTTASSA